MSASVFEDALALPDLFHWFGLIEADFNTWLKALPIRIHPGLVSFWRRTGGGSLFESETILGPLVADEGENVLEVNQAHWKNGLSPDMLVFHTGCCWSASYVDRRRHRNLILSLKCGSYEIQQRFDTFSMWYENTLRIEYAKRYGLATD
jgi:hypothetical protein